MLWKNGEGTYLLGANNTGLLEARGLFISGTDIYIAGSQEVVTSATEYTAAALWKNGITTRLNSAGIASRANNVFVLGSIVYAAGGVSATTSIYDSKPTYWTNGSATSLSSSYGFVNSIQASGTDVYNTGYLVAPPPFAAILWKNDSPQSYVPSCSQCGLNASVITGSSLYAVGGTDQGAAFWKDGVLTNLNTGDPKGNATAVVVTQD